MLREIEIPRAKNINFLALVLSNVVLLDIKIPGLRMMDDDGRSRLLEIN
jgi:hypothetical protein